jgi:hypothetical protein
MENARVRVFLDDGTQPIADQELRSEVSLDTSALADGPHKLTIRALSESGHEGVKEIPFVVHNGPGIVVSGLHPHSIRRGEVRFTVDAFSVEDPFDPRRAEARSSIPVWVWVMTLFVIAWAVGTPRACGMCRRNFRIRRPIAVSHFRIIKRRRRSSL